jgi:hypothetical protein
MISSNWRRLAALMFSGAAAVISALWIAICAAAPEFIWQGLRIGLGHLTRADLFSGLLLGLILAFFVEPLIRHTNYLLGSDTHRVTRESRNPLFTAALSFAFALVSVCVHDAMIAFVSGRGAANMQGSGLQAAIALTIAWSIVPFAITLAWSSMRSRWFRVPIGTIAAASAGFAGWLFSWSVQEVVTTTIPCLLILGFGYRRILREPKLGVFKRCARVVFFTAAGWLSVALLFDAVLGRFDLDQAARYSAAHFWMDVRFYLGWAIGLVFAPSPFDSLRGGKT